MDPQTQLTKSVEETYLLAKKVTIDLFAKAKSTSLNTIVVLLKGPLGSGKTTFTKGIAKALGIEGNIKSPTYTYSNHYKFTQNKESWTLIHFDLYRLDEEISNPEQVKAEIGLEEALNSPNTLVIIEWPERLEIGNVNLILEFETEEEGHRITKIIKE
jgi:tRNA threonylcarbamoyladenosine biosynthesis protein TsaE